MHKQRLEAFSDGVIAIILTIMVLELKVPKEATLDSLRQLWPTWLAYALSYYNVFALWVAHHDALSRTTEVDRGILFANGLFLFCTSLIPFATAFAGEAHWASPLPVVLYGLVMVLVSLSLGRLRRKLSVYAANPEVAMQAQEEARQNYRFAALFLLASVSALVHPRVGLVVLVAIPIIARVLHGSRRRAGRAA